VRRATGCAQDGFAQLGRVPGEELRGRVRIQFVDEYGAEEAGVDGGGLFKDFLERLVHTLRPMCIPYVAPVPAGACVAGGLRCSPAPRLRPQTRGSVWCRLHAGFDRRAPGQHSAGPADPGGAAQVREGFDPRLGLFATTADQRLYPAPAAPAAVPGALAYYEFLGRMIGKAVYEARARGGRPACALLLCCSCRLSRRVWSAHASSACGAAQPPAACLCTAGGCAALPPRAGSSRPGQGPAAARGARATRPRARACLCPSSH
jgi:hypothetical protein